MTEERKQKEEKKEESKSVQKTVSINNVQKNIKDGKTEKSEEVSEKSKDVNKDVNQATVEVSAKSVPSNLPARIGDTTGKPTYRERRRNGRSGFRREEEQSEFEQRIIDIARVTRVMAGGKRMRFRACIVIGNKKGKVAVGLAKGSDVTIAVTKAVNQAKKNLIDVPIVNDTIPHEIRKKYGAAKIILKPARKGRGIIAGGAVRIVLELTGIKNITSKILGSNNKVNNARCVIEALKSLKKVGSKKDKAEKKREDMEMRNKSQK